MFSWRNLGLLTKINLVLAVVLISIFLFSSFLQFRQQKQYVLNEALEKARLVAMEAIRSRDYLSGQIEAGEVELSLERYGLIPVVASQRIGERIGMDFGYSVRQTSLRYRNSKNAPNAFERLSLEGFLRDPSRQEDYAVTTEGGTSLFRYLKPFRVEESCLACHGSPDDAPDFLKQLFPPDQDRAYNYQIGDTIGAASVSIPMATLEAQVHHNLRTDLWTLAGAFLALVLCLGLLIRLTVTGPLARFERVVGRVIQTGRFEERLRRRGSDEIGRLIDRFNEMTETLQQQTRHLEESDTRFRALTETARDAIVTFLDGGQIILFNRQAERIFGYSKAEALGMEISRLLAPGTLAEGESVGACIKDKGPDWLGALQEIRAQRRDGRAMMLEVAISEAESDGHQFYTAILREVAAED